MKRLTLMIAATALVVAAVPATALAQRHHHGHHARFRHFGNQNGMTPTAPTPVGTVTSFTNGALTITLTNGSTLTGNVTPDTRLVCLPSSSSTGTGSTGSNTGGWSGRHRHFRDRDQGGDQGWGNGGQGGQGDQGGQGQMSTCTPTTGMSVFFAELRITSAGESWETVVLG